MIAHELLFDGDVRDIQRILSIGPNVSVKDNLLALKLASSEALWLALLEVQFHLCKPAELPFLYSDESFLKSRSVLEIGFGDTGVIGGLKSYFPDKEFVEVNFPTSLILKPKQKIQPFLEILSRQMGKHFTRKFDFIVLRVVLQIVSRIGLVTQSIKGHLAGHGRLFIIDAGDSLKKWSPEIPSLDLLWGSLEKDQTESGSDRTAAEKIYRRASLYGLRPERNEKAPAASHHEVDLRSFYGYWLMLSEAMNRAFGQKLDQMRLIHDLNRWIADPKASCQFGLQFVELAHSSSR